MLVLSKDAVARLSHSLDPEKKPVVVPDVADHRSGSEARKEGSGAESSGQETGGEDEAAKPARKKGKE